jgi:hypothetical protein
VANKTPKVVRKAVKPSHHEPKSDMWEVCKGRIGSDKRKKYLKCLIGLRRKRRHSIRLNKFQ